MFDIHKVRPVHGWREFIGEVGIIVLGVMIALAAESAVEEWRWHEQVGQTRNALKGEILEAAVNSLEREAIEPCLRSDIVSLLHTVTSGPDTFAGRPLPSWHPSNDDTVIPPAYSTPNRPYIIDAWKNALASGVFSHLSAEEKRGYGRLAISAEELSAMQHQEYDVASRLAPLSFAGRLDPQLRSRYITDLALVDKLDHATMDYAAYYLDTIRSMHLGFDKSEVNVEVGTMLADERSFRGGCVRRLALNLN